ncbi:hypothetical protein AAHA92_04353 [Salvia divinorum]|uniref:EF-hand domain-containing protein n=1 Tax=Salvia divinorum TaxID=28513 RepID=A0ABD1HZU1_SALDI
MKEMQTVGAEAVEEVREIAKFYYDSATPQVQEQAKHFFNSMDLDGNGEINLVEFLSFMREEGYFKQMRNNSFFKMLDASGRGSLAFMDVITLYYIIKSGRPLCDSCSQLIPGTFFSCAACFNRPGDSFNLCRSCHLKTKNYDDHKHDGRAALFLDNFTLLQAAKLHLTTTSKQAAHNEPTAKTQQPLLLGKGDSASISKSTSKDGDTKSKKLASVTPAKSVATTPTASKHNQNAIVPATKPAAQTKPTRQSPHHEQPLLPVKGGSTSTSTSKNDAITSYMTSVFDRLVREQTRSPSRPLNHSPSVNVARSESTTSTPNTFIESRPNQHAIVPATQQKKAPWMTAASVALKALDAMVVIGNVVGAVSACTIM